MCFIAVSAILLGIASFGLVLNFVGSAFVMDEEAFDYMRGIAVIWLATTFIVGIRLDALGFGYWTGLSILSFTVLAPAVLWLFEASVSSFVSSARAGSQTGYFSPRKIKGNATATAVYSDKTRNVSRSVGSDLRSNYGPVRV